ADVARSAHRRVFAPALPRPSEGFLRTVLRLVTKLRHAQSRHRSSVSELCWVWWCTRKHSVHTYSSVCGCTTGADKDSSVTSATGGMIGSSASGSPSVARMAVISVGSESGSEAESTVVMVIFELLTIVCR